MRVRFYSKISFKSTKVFVFCLIWLQVPMLFFMLLVHTPAITNRLKYIFTLVIRDMLGLEIQFTSSADEFREYPGPKFSYSDRPLADGLFIEASNLLFEEGVICHELNVSWIGGIPIIFKTGHPLSLLPFDPFAAAFYMVSRYEEYLPHQTDKYGRFTAAESIAMKGNFLEVPVIHLWAEKVGKLLLEHHPGLAIRYPEYRYLPTIDVDHAYCYRGRTPVRTLGGIGRDIARGHLDDVLLRIKVLYGLAADPYDNYSFINRVHAQYGQNPLYFILFADHGGDDNNISVTSEIFHVLLHALDRHKGVAIHPSLSSNKSHAKLLAEYNALCQVLQREVTSSRQHFLHLRLPQTYRSLIQLGISDDYSMGYASHPGFRAGIAVPFQFFDLGSNETTNLVVHPVSLMDVTMKDYLRLSTEESTEIVNRMIKTIKSVHGEFVSLWHNESLGDTGRWRGWRRVYEEMVKSAST